MSSEKREASPEASPLKGPAPKAVPEDTSEDTFEDGIPLNPMAGDQAVQFVSGTPANGDAKVEIGGDPGATAPTFVGLGKEELMKYANDPFWVKMRWFLFILFWVLWIGMLLGAILIIVYAPRCAEKKTVAETYYQIKASDLVKDSKIDENTQNLRNLGVQNIIITEALQHEGNEPESVTAFDKFDEEISEGLITSAIEELRRHGMKILLQIVPNHSGTSHEWFNETSSSEKYVRKPYSDIDNKSVWMTQDRKHTAWHRDNRTGFENTAYLQQFSGNVADLNFKNEGIVDAFKQIFNRWRERSIDGFSILKASYLVEDLDNLMVRNATINQPDNVKILSRIVGISSQGPILVELDEASDETIQQYVDKGMTPLLKSIDVSSSADKIQDGLEMLNRNPKAVINLSKHSPERSRLINLLASAGGSHTLLNSDSSDSSDFLMKLVQFQKQNPRGKNAKFTYATNNDVVATLRSDGDDHLILANMGQGKQTFNPASHFNITETAKGQVVLATSNAQQKHGGSTQGNIDLSPLSGLVIKLENQEPLPH